MRNTVSLLLLGALPLAAQSPRPDSAAAITTDRPDFTESAYAVGRGIFQLESGFTVQQLGTNSHAMSAPELLLRYGLSNRVELRVGLPDFARAIESGRVRSGAGDAYAGLKVPLLDGRAGALALIPALNLPIGADHFTSGSVDPELKVTWSRDLSPRLALASMGYGLLTSAGAERVLVYQHTVTLGRELRESLDAFVEWAGSVSRLDAPDHVAHAGFAIARGPSAQFDVHAGVSLGGGHRRPFLAGGYAVKW